MRPSTTNPDRAALESDIERFLAAGGKITQPTSKYGINPIEWQGNHQTAKYLRTLAGLASTLQIDTSKVESALQENGAPQCYIYRGEYHWCSRAVEDYMKRRKTLEYSRNGLVYKERAV